MAITTLKSLLQAAAPRTYIALNNTVKNWRSGKANRRFLIVRHPRKPDIYQIVLDFVERVCPELRNRFELRTLGCRIRDWSPYILHIPWLKDPVQRWSMAAYEQAAKLSAQCDAHDIPIINRPDRLTNAAKAEGAKRMAVCGLRTPQMAVITDIAEFRKTLLGIEPPLLVRENWGHGQPMQFAATHDAARQLPIESFRHPIAVEYVDVRDPADGLYRKYRYVIAGEYGVPMHLHVSTEWAANGSSMLYSDSVCDEDREFLDSPNPHHEAFLQACQSLGLDFAALDYSYDQSGQVVLWEANPLPLLHYPRRRKYRIPALESALAAVVSLYLTRAGLEIPPAISDRLTRSLIPAEKNRALLPTTTSPT